jgi:hypothetical protein
MSGKNYVNTRQAVVTATPTKEGANSKTYDEREYEPGSFALL